MQQATGATKVPASWEELKHKGRIWELLELGLNNCDLEPLGRPLPLLLGGGGGGVGRSHLVGWIARVMELPDALLKKTEAVGALEVRGAN